MGPSRPRDSRSGQAVAHRPRCRYRVEFAGMFNALFAFFSSFNPIVFGLVLSVGAVILVRRPGSAVPLRTSAERQSASKAPWRRP